MDYLTQKLIFQFGPEPSKFNYAVCIAKNNSSALRVVNIKKSNVRPEYV